MTKNRKPVRRADVAAAAGVAPTTVSLVLNRHPGVNIPESTRKRVFDAAERLGYRPSRVACSLSSGQTRTVGVVLHFLSNPFQVYSAGVLNGAWPVFRERRYRLLIDEGSDECGASNLFHEKCVDGLLVLAPPSHRRAGGELEAVIESGFPAVLVGASLKGDPLDYVDIDNVGAGRMATEALLAAGHRRIAHITGPLEMSSAARDRRKGYRAALRQAGVSVDDGLIAEGNWLAESGREASASLLRAGVDFTAVFAGNDNMACGAIEALRASGLSVPGDISVVGVDGFTEHAPAGVKLATVRQPLAAIGRLAAERLLDQMQGGAGGGQPVRAFVPGVLELGNTLRALCR